MPEKECVMLSNSPPDRETSCNKSELALASVAQPVGHHCVHRKVAGWIVFCSFTVLPAKSTAHESPPRGCWDYCSSLPSCWASSARISRKPTLPLLALFAFPLEIWPPHHSMPQVSDDAIAGGRMSSTKKPRRYPYREMNGRNSLHASFSATTASHSPTVTAHSHWHALSTATTLPV